jgi:hypothetical protein
LTLDEVQELHAEFRSRVEIFFPVPRSRGPEKVDSRP